MGKLWLVGSVLFCAAWVCFIAVNQGYWDVSFLTIQQDGDTFNSTQGLIEYLQRDSLSDREWTAKYTCDNFAKDFIVRAEEKNYYCFRYHVLQNDNLIKFNSAVAGIRVTKQVPDGFETRSYSVAPFVSGVGHAVVKVTVGGAELLVDPQTDVVLTSNFEVVYKGEITE